MKQLLSTATFADDVVPLVLRDGGDSIAISEEVAEVFFAQPDGHLARYQLRVIVRRGSGVGNSFGFWLCSGNCVGSARFTHGERSVDVVVLPKVGNPSVLRLLSELGLAPPDEDLVASFGARFHECALSLIEAVIRIIDDVTSRPLLRRYSQRTSDDVRSVKGRIELSRYATRNVPQMKHYRVPCRFFELGADIPDNQILAAALDRACRLLPLVPLRERAAVVRAATRARKALGIVSIPAQPIRLLDELSYTHSNRRLRHAHVLCRLFLLESSVVLDTAAALTSQAFFVNMASLFETFVMRALTIGFGAQCVSQRTDLTFNVGSDTRYVVLDGLLRLSTMRYVIECKYVLSGSSLGTGQDRPAYDNAHVFQAVAYANHRRVHAGGVLLVYPSHNNQESVALIAELDNFCCPSGNPLHIYVIHVNLASSLSDVARGLTNFIQFRAPPSDPIASTQPRFPSPDELE